MLNIVEGYLLRTNKTKKISKAAYVLKKKLKKV